MPAGQGNHPETRDAERLAAAIEQGTPPRATADAELARDLEIVAMLRSQRAAYDPLPDARARAKQRLMAALAQDDVPAGPGDPTTRLPVTPPVGPAHATAVTAELGRIDDAGPDPTIGTVAESTVADTVVAGTTGTAPVEAPDVAASRRSLRPGRAGRHSMPSRPGARAGAARGPAGRGLRRRAVTAGVVAMVALLAVAGVGNLSRDALPGDALYAVKRLSESTGTALTFGEQARAQRHLQLATTRIDEVERLVAGGSAPEAALLEDAMQDFDGSTGEGSRMLLAAEDGSGSAALGDLQAWASEQAARLSVLRSALPADAMSEADRSMALLDRLLGRTEAIEARSDCSEVTSSVVDDLGRLPAEGTCSPRPVTSDEPSTSATTDSGTTTTAPDETTTGSDPTADTTAPQESTTTEDGLVPEQLGPDGLPLPDPTSEGAQTSSSTEPGEDDGPVSIPLPLLPPIQLPPLLPGMPGVVIN